MKVAEDIAFYRTMLSLALVFGGVLAIYFGFLLFSNGAGLKRGLTKLQMKSETYTVSLAGISVGAVLMISSCVWGIAAWQSFPTMAASADGAISISHIEDEEYLRKLLQTVNARYQGSFEVVGEPYVLPPAGTPIDTNEIKSIAGDWKKVAEKLPGDPDKVLVLWGQKIGGDASRTTSTAFLDALEQAGANVTEVQLIDEPRMTEEWGEIVGDHRAGAALLAIEPRANPYRTGG